jgi:hypothetical protein
LEHPTHIALKLITNETVVGRLDSFSEDGYVLDNPLIVHHVYEDNGARIFFTPWNTFSKERTMYPFKSSHVLFETEIEPMLIKFYEKSLLGLREDNRRSKKFKGALPTDLSDDDLLRAFLNSHLSSNNVLN